MAIQTYVLILLIAAVISVGASLAVVLTCMTFRNMRDKLFMHMIAFISLSDLLGNIAYAFPYRPSNDDWWCKVSGVLNLVCYPMSWLWTLVLVYFLYSLATSGKVPQNMLMIHSICWGLPLLLFLLSLSVGKLGTTSSYYDFEVCSEYGGIAELVYHSITYYGLLFFCFLAMLVMFVRIKEHEKVGDVRVFQPTYILAKSSLRLYPTALVVCWVPHAITVFLTHEFDSSNDMFTTFFVVADVLKILHGLVTAGIFFYKSSEARRSWYTLFFSSINDAASEISYVKQRTYSEVSQISAQISHVYEEDLHSRLLDEPLEGR